MKFAHNFKRTGGIYGQIWGSLRNNYTESLGVNNFDKMLLIDAQFDWQQQIQTHSNRFETLGNFPKIQVDHNQNLLEISGASGHRSMPVQKGKLIVLDSLNPNEICIFICPLLGVVNF